MDGYCQNWLKNNKLPVLYQRYYADVNIESIPNLPKLEDYHRRPSYASLVPNWTRILDIFGNLTLSKRDIKMMMLIYDENNTQLEVAEELNISQPTISIRHKSIIKKLKLFYKNEK